MKLIACIALLAAPLAASAAPLFRRQATTTDASPPTASPTETSALPPGLSPFGPTAQLTVWQVLELNPSFTNYTSLALQYAPELVAVLNNTANIEQRPRLPQQEDGGDGGGGDGGGQPARRNFTVFAPTDLTMQQVLNEPFTRALLQSNNQAAIAPLMSRFLGYHTALGNVASANIPPAGEIATVPTLAGFDAVVQRAVNRPAAPINLGPALGVLTTTVSVPVATTTATATITTPGTSETEEGETASVAQATDAPPTNGGATGAEKLWVNTAEIVFGDVAASNGIVNVVDQVLEPLFGFFVMPPIELPPASPTQTEAAGGGTTAGSAPTGTATETGTEAPISVPFATSVSTISVPSLEPTETLV